ncbi:MAG: triose-phosphate isomerase [Candidatus Dormibacteria bacterium]
MHPEVEFTPPFFEVGPKAYMYGPPLVHLARVADELSAQFGVQIILTPQSVDINPVATAVERVLVFAQHMDSLSPGRGMGSVLPEALRAAGAVGVMLNHAERQLKRAELAATVRRAAAVGLATLVCASDLEAAQDYARLFPNGIVLEAPDRIGTGSPRLGSADGIRAQDAAIHRIAPRVRVLHAAGIGSPKDVFRVIASGADGTGSTSAIFGAPDPAAALSDMIRATREGWDARVQEEVV